MDTAHGGPLDILWGHLPAAFVPSVVCRRIFPIVLRRHNFYLRMTGFNRLSFAYAPCMSDYCPPSRAGFTEEYLLQLTRGFDAAELLGPLWCHRLYCYPITRRRNPNPVTRNTSTCPNAQP